MNFFGLWVEKRPWASGVEAGNMWGALFSVQDWMSIVAIKTIIYSESKVIHDLLTRYNAYKKERSQSWLDIWP